MITRERFPSHEATNSSEQGKSFDYEKYGISPTVESNSFDNDGGTPHEWTPAGRAEKVNDARDAVAIAFGDKPPAMARQESNTGRQLLVGEAYKAATDGGAAPTNERASTRRVFMTGEKITGKLPSHANAERGPQSVGEMLDRRADLLAKGAPEDMVDSIVMGEHSKDRGDNLVQYASRPPVEHAAYEQPVIHEEPKEPVSHENTTSAAMPVSEKALAQTSVENPEPKNDKPKVEVESFTKVAAEAPKEDTPSAVLENSENIKVNAAKKAESAEPTTAEKPVEQNEQPNVEKAEKLPPAESNPDDAQDNEAESEANVSKNNEGQDDKEENNRSRSERLFDQARANEQAESFLKAYSRYFDSDTRALLSDRLSAGDGLNITPDTIKAMYELAREAGPHSAIWQTESGNKSALQKVANQNRQKLKSIVESL
ncbi:MAG: hypothetical protein LP071_03060 [Candidatus Nanogingivalaceae bacterium]|nr:hypothetical protein [Candidatus Nanogingivalaceae bacterium]